jgi:hypothetical protein
MTTKTTTDRLSSADLAARLRERAVEYEEAGREKLRAESALLAAFSNYERARYRFDRDRAEWDARAAGFVSWQATDERHHLGRFGGSPEGHGPALCGVPYSSQFIGFGPRWADCEDCFAALDEVAP